jgi:glycosyltransferase involved in cell wall biosynthesis
MVERLLSLEGGAGGKDVELHREIKSKSALLAELAEERRNPRQLVPESRKSVYFLHFSLPYSSVGYATRSHGLLASLGRKGYDVRAYTRCGFPQDSRDDLAGAELPSLDVVDEVVYHRLVAAGRRGCTESEYLLKSADAYEVVLRRERPEIVHAASNYVTALPALLAARRLGLPFIYEIRGFWEITRTSRDRDFENSARFALMKQFEAHVARQSDHVFTLTSAMKDELVRRGVDERKISLVHNGVDGHRFAPLQRDAQLAEELRLPPDVPIVGYVGSLLDYEGLDDLVAACATLIRSGLNFRLLIVGDGAALSGLRQLVEAEQLQSQVLLLGRVPHDRVHAYYSLMDICPFPRKAWDVCEMVSPLKPFEAMAMGKAVLVSSTHALREIVDDGRTGLVFQKGSRDDLASALRRLITDPALRATFAEKRRAWALDNRTWDHSAEAVLAGYERLRAPTEGA